MARNVTLTELVERVRLYLDRDTDDSITDEFIVIALNAGLAELHGKLVQANENYKVSHESFQTVAGTEYYDLPADFLKLQKLEIADGDGYADLKNYSLAESNRQWRGSTGIAAGRYRYDIVGDQVSLRPIPTAVDTIRFRYIPCAATLVADDMDDQVIDGINGWEEIPILIACRKVLTRLNRSTTAIQEELDRQFKRIQTEADGRNSGAPPRIQDVERR